MKKHAFAVKMVDEKKQALNPYEDLLHLKQTVISEGASRNLALGEITAQQFMWQKEKRRFSMSNTSFLWQRYDELEKVMI